MEINLTVEQEAQLSHFAALEGKAADELAREVFLRGLHGFQVEETLIASRTRRTEGQEAIARMLELRKGNMLPEGVNLKTSSAMAGLDGLCPR